MFISIGKYFSRALCVAAILSFSTVSMAQVSDKIIAIVNDDVITAGELNKRASSYAAERGVSKIDENSRQRILQKLVEEKVQEQRAKQLGISVSDAELRQLEEQFVRSKGSTKEKFRQNLVTRGIDYDIFLSDLRTQNLIRKLVRSDAIRAVSVSENELDGFIKVNNIKPSSRAYDVSYLLSKFPDGADRAQQQALFEKVNKIRIASNPSSFQALNKSLSSANIRAVTKDLGVRKNDQLPEIFVAALDSIKVGELTDTLATPSGLYVLRLNGVKGAKVAVQKRKAQHILISADSALKVEQARKKLLKMKGQIVAGEDFSLLAQYYSDDSGSAAKGGDLGWVRKGEMVPPFERALFALKEGQLSDIVVSNFGVHLIKLNGISTSNDPKEEVRAIAYNELMSQKLDQFYPAWLSQLVGRAYVKYL